MAKIRTETMKKIGMIWSNLFATYFAHLYHLIFALFNILTFPFVRREKDITLYDIFHKSLLRKSPLFSDPAMQAVLHVW